MFELTVRGITKQFATAEEMELWRQSMAAPRMVKKRLPRKRTRKSVSLKQYVDKLRNDK